MLRSAVLTVLAAHVVFLATIAFGAPCAERCPDDGPDGRCPPACITCPCSPRPASPPAAVECPHPVAAPARLPAPVMLAPSEPDPIGIFHVPRAVLA